jgi:hypothetical protein
MENAILVHMLAQAQVREILARAERDHLAYRAAIRVADRPLPILARIRSLVTRIGNSQVAVGKLRLSER